MTNYAAPRRPVSRRAKSLGAAVSAALVACGALALAGNATAGEERRRDTGDGTEAAAAPGTTFAPYVDTSLQPSYDLVKRAEETGVREFNLAFITSGGGCTPKWGGTQELGENAVARQIDALRAKGGDVRVSVTPMIGVNDVIVEVFRPDDAAEVKKFADEQGMGWLSMWSATRDKACPGGPKDQADPTCSSIEQGADDFAKAFTG
ncbi:MAG: hypothetical protein ACRDOV_15280 [Streptomyces sp.]